MYRLMMVDDQKIIMEGIRDIIRQSDLPFSDFMIAESGEELLARLESYAPDAIITDIKMAGISGLSMIQSIRNRRDRYKDIPVVILSGYDEFEYARQAIQSSVAYYLLKPVSREELYGAMHQVCDRLEEQRAHAVSGLDKRSGLLRSAMNGSVSAKEFPGGDAAKGPFLLAQFLPREPDAAFRAAMGKIAVEWDKSLHSVYEREKDVLCLIKGSRLPGAKALPPLPKTVEVNLSAPLRSLAQLPQALKQIRLVHLKRSVISEQAVVSFDDISSSDFPLSIRLEDVRLICEAVSRGDAKGLSALLDDIYTRLVSCESPTFEHFCAYYSALCMELYKRYFNITLLDELSEEFNFLLHSASVFADMPGADRIAAEAARNMLSLCRKIPKHGVRNLVLAAKSYISEHPETNLGQLAQRMHVSSQYLSTLFHKETGQPFSAFLITQRIEKAKRMLESTVLPVSEIGRSVGYISEKHFFVVFKRMEGCSPAKYRQLKRIEKAKMGGL